MSGMNSFYRSACKYRCFWCWITSDDLSNRKNKASRNGGIIGQPILEIDPDHTMPCLMHAIMAIVRKLIKNLDPLLVQQPDLEDVFCAAFEEIGARIVKPKKDLSFCKRLKKSRFNRSEYLHLGEKPFAVLSDRSCGSRRNANNRISDARGVDPVSSFGLTCP